jgi:uncharacterized protein YvpB
MTLENGWLQRAYSANKASMSGSQISDLKSQIIKAQFVSYAVTRVDQEREACFLPTTKNPILEDH